MLSSTGAHYTFIDLILISKRLSRLSFTYCIELNIVLQFWYSWLPLSFGNICFFLAFTAMYRMLATNLYNSKITMCVCNNVYGVINDIINKKVMLADFCLYIIYIKISLLYVFKYCIKAIDFQFLPRSVGMRWWQ